MITVSSVVTVFIARYSAIVITCAILLMLLKGFVCQFVFHSGSRNIVDILFRFCGFLSFCLWIKCTKCALLLLYTERFTESSVALSAVRYVADAVL